jgi:hypothetical protein
MNGLPLRQSDIVALLAVTSQLWSQTQSRRGQTAAIVARRDYMREYMRRYRARKAGDQGRMAFKDTAKAAG